LEDGQMKNMTALLKLFDFMESNGEKLRHMFELDLELRLDHMLKNTS